MKMYGFNESGKRFTVLGSLRGVVRDLINGGRAQHAFNLIICSLYRDGGVIPDGVSGDSVRELTIEL